MSYWRPSGAGGPLIRPAGPAEPAPRASGARFAGPLARSAGPRGPRRGPARPAPRARRAPNKLACNTWHTEIELDSLMMRLARFEPTLLG